MENLAERVGKLEKARTSATSQIQSLETNLNINASSFNPDQQWWPEVDYSQYPMPNFAMDPLGFGYGMGMPGWEDPFSILAARVAALEAFKEEASVHLKNLKERVVVLERSGALEPTSSKGKSEAGMIAKPPGLDMGEADTSASDSDAKGHGAKQGDISSSDDDTALKDQEQVLNSVLENVYESDAEDGSEVDDLPPPPPQPSGLSRQTSEMISFATQPDSSVQISWLFTNFRAKMVKQLGRASVSPSINNADKSLEDARILISPLGSIDKMPRSRKEKAAYTKVVEKGPFCPYLQLKVPSKQTMTFCFMLGNHYSEKQTHDFGSSPMSGLVKIESGQCDWLQHIHEGDLTLTLKIFA